MENRQPRWGGGKVRDEKCLFKYTGVLRLHLSLQLAGDSQLHTTHQWLVGGASRHSIGRINHPAKLLGLQDIFVVLFYCYLSVCVLKYT